MDDNEIEIVEEVYPALRCHIPKEFEEKWSTQSSCSDPREFLKNMLDSSELSDVIFLMKNASNDDVKVRAHKCVLREKSDFFKTLFCDRWEQQDVIDLTGAIGIKDHDFRTFLEYLYTGATAVNQDNVLAMYHLSNVYLSEINALKAECETFLLRYLNQDNVFKLFDAVFAYNAEKKSALFMRFIEFICKDGDRLLDNGNLKVMDLAKLSAIFESGNLKCRPLQMLRFCFQWICYNCGGVKALWDYTEVDRRICEDFKVSSSFHIPRLRSILNMAPQNPEEIKGKVNRFGNVSSKAVGWKYRRGRADRLSFRVSHPIFLTGLGFYGSKFADPESPYSKYDVDIVVYHHGKQRSELLNTYERGGGLDVDFCSKIFKVNVDPCYIHPDTWYTIAVKISGSESFFGEDGVPEKLCQCGKTPIIFEFQEAASNDDNFKLSNPTGVPVGQIPEIFYTLATGDDDDVKIL